jgi:DNA-binding CsgD family transcriptional regulator
MTDASKTGRADRLRRVSLFIGFVCYVSWDRLIQNALLIQDVTVYNLCLFAGLTALVCMLVIAFAAQRFGWAPKRTLLIGTTALAVLSDLLLWLVPFQAVSLFCVCLQNLCSPLFLVAWGCVLSQKRPAQIVREVAAALIVALALVLLTRLVSTDILPPLLVILPLISGIALSFVKPPAAAASRADETIACAPIRRPFDWAFLSIFALCCIVAAFFSGVVIDPYVINSNTITLYMALIVIAFMTMLATWSALTTTHNMKNAFFGVLLLLVTGLLLFSIGVLQSLILPIAIVLAASNCLFGFAWVVFAQLASEDDHRPAPVFALGMLVCNGIIPMYLGILVNRTLGAGFYMVTEIAIACIAVFAVSYILISHLYTRMFDRTAEEAAEAMSAAREIIPEDLTTEQTLRAFQSCCNRTVTAYGLTERESEVFELIVQGLSGPAIGKALFISPSTVKFHTKNIYNKCGVGNRGDLLALFEMNGQQ